MAEQPDHAGAEIDEQGRNPTQRRLDEQATPDAPVDAPWAGDAAPGGGSEAVTAGGEPPPRVDEAVSQDSGVEVAQPDPVAGTSPAIEIGGGDVSFEPDVSLTAEVNREQSEAGGRKRRLALGGAAAGVLAALAALVRRRRR